MYIRTLHSSELQENIILEMTLNPKRLFEQMCFKCRFEGWHTTTAPDLFWQIVPQTRSQNTKSAVTICHTFRGWHNKQIITWWPQIMLTVGAWDQIFCQVDGPLAIQCLKNKEQDLKMHQEMGSQCSLWFMRWSVTWSYWLPCLDL